MKKHIWIFGDSFAEKWTGPATEDKISWPELLENDYVVTNFGLSGSGPDYQLGLLKEKLLERDAFSHVSVIFLLSYSARIDFSFLKSPKHSYLMGRIVDYQGCQDTPDITNIINSYKPYVPFLNNFYKYYFFHRDHELDFFKRVSLLKDLSHCFEKILIIPVFDNIQEFKLAKVFKHRSHSNCYIASGDGLGWYATQDPQAPNHLVRKNHLLLHRMLKLWIDDCTNINIKNLRKSA